MTETLFTRKVSYLAKADDIRNVRERDAENVLGDVYANRLSRNRMDVVGVGRQLVITLLLPRSGYELTGANNPLFRSTVWPGGGRNTFFTFNVTLAQYAQASGSP